MPVTDRDYFPLSDIGYRAVRAIMVSEEMLELNVYFDSCFRFRGKYSDKKTEVCQILSYTEFTL